MEKLLSGRNWLLSAFIISFSGTLLLAEENSLSSASPDDAVALDWQGEYTGTMRHDGNEYPMAAQIVAGGDGTFSIVGYPGGLPGAGWQGEAPHRFEATLDNGQLLLQTGGKLLKDGDNLTVVNTEGTSIGQFKSIERRSPTLNLPPPPHAVALFDGSSADAFENGRLTPDGLLMEGVMSHEKHQDARVHLEFRTPFMPAARGQARGNSGVYLQGRYEVQILDSFGLEGLDNECGGIYGVKAPDLNMAFPPGAWQTYDIEFTAARFNAQNEKIADAQLTVRHNGVVVHRGVSVSGPTRAAKFVEGPEPGPLYLQDHGNPVRFRNIWIVNKPVDASR